MTHKAKLAANRLPPRNAPLAVLGVHHIALICSDYPRSKAFYTELLGLRIVAETYRAARDSWKLDMAMADGTQLELFSFPGAPLRLSHPEAQGLRHLAFRIADIAAARSELLAAGLVVEQIRVDEITGKRFAFFADPDGLPLELYEI